VVGVRVRALRGQEIGIRPGTSDAEVLFYTFFHRFHLPPKVLSLNREVALTVVDLGANIGLTMAHYASLFPTARVLGIELDRQNAQLCERNIRTYGERCQVVEGAVWREDGFIDYEPAGSSQDAFTATALGLRSGTTRVSVRAMALDSLLSLHGVSEVGFLKVDVEGAERELFQGTPEWPQRVRSLKVEVHGSYSRGLCISDLARLGFAAYRDRNHAAGVIGIRTRSENR